MKLLLREHIPLLLIYLLQLAFTILICWLDGYRNTFALLYAVFLSTFLLACYLAYRYIRHRSLYRSLSMPNADRTLEGMLEPPSQVPLVAAWNQMMSTQYRLYHNEINRYETKIKNRVIFMDQWVHQMKTPLSVIHLTIQQENDPVFDQVREELDRLSEGLETVLYSSRLDQFEHDFVVESVHLDRMIQEVIAKYRRLFIRNRIYPDNRVDKSWIVASDEKWLSFIFTQLVTNAVRYSRGVGQNVHFSVHLRGKHVILEVTDEGIGIPPEDQKRVFDAYFTGHNGRQYDESTGMGLYLVQEVCRRLGHRVELESQPGVGTTVRLVFQEALES